MIIINYYLIKDKIESILRWVPAQGSGQGLGPHQVVCCHQPTHWYGFSLLSLSFFSLFYFFIFPLFSFSFFYYFFLFFFPLLFFLSFFLPLLVLIGVIRRWLSEMPKTTSDYYNNRNWAFAWKGYDHIQSLLKWLIIINDIIILKKWRVHKH